MRVFLLVALAVLRQGGAAPAAAQDPATEPVAWALSGIRTAFCVQFLLDPKSDALRELPRGFRPAPASAVSDLHLSLRDVVQSQPEYAAWSPSRICFVAADTILGKDIRLVDRKGKHPQLVGLWTVAATAPSGQPQDVALGVFANSGRLSRSAGFAGQRVRDASLKMGKVPVVDVNGVPSSDDRFQVKLIGTTLIWDGRWAAESTTVAEPLRSSWMADGLKGGTVGGRLELRPSSSHAMVGSLKVDGKDAFAKALRASPTRFAGPAYRGGTVQVGFTRRGAN
jgi:hypothetical protein